MNKKLIIIPLLLTQLVFADQIQKQQDCAEDAVTFYWTCHRNSLDKAERGNFADFSDQKCEKLLVDKLQKCFGEKVKLSDCEKDVVDRYFVCQSNLNDKYQAGNLSAGMSDECSKLLINDFTACNKTEVKPAPATTDQATKPAAATSSTSTAS